MSEVFGLESLDRSVDMAIFGKRTENVTGDTKVTDWNEMVIQRNHLKDIQFLTVGKRSRMDILIGLDHIDLHYS